MRQYAVRLRAVRAVKAPKAVKAVKAVGAQRAGGGGHKGQEPVVSTRTGRGTKTFGSGLACLLLGSGRVALET